jgi:hypothetical protein
MTKRPINHIFSTTKLYQLTPASKDSTASPATKPIAISKIIHKIDRLMDFLMIFLGSSGIKEQVVLGKQ